MSAEALPSDWRAWPLERRVRLRDRLRLEEWQQRYWSDPVGFARDCVRADATPYQEDVWRGLAEKGKVAVRGPHGMGKGFELAVALWWFVLTRMFRDWKAPTTSGSWQQLEHFLWPEIRKVHDLIDWTTPNNQGAVPRAPLKRGTELLDMAIKLPGGEAFAINSNDSSRMEGVHADHVFFGYDEAKIIPDDTFDATQGAFAGAGLDTGREAFQMVQSTPGEPAGRFHELHQPKGRRLGFYQRHVTIEECLEAGRISGEWPAERAEEWGTESALYKNRVLGLFASDAGSNVLPDDWIQAARERGRFRASQLAALTSQAQAGDEGAAAELAALMRITAAGVDVADGGADRTVLAIRRGRSIDELRVHPQARTMECAGRTVGILRANESAYAIVDVIGVGAGVVGRVREQVPEHRCIAFNASSRSDATDATGELHFDNKRAEAWWRLRELLQPPSQVALPWEGEDAEMLAEELAAPRIMPTTSRGSIRIEPKDEIRKRLGRSPDLADAVVMAFEPGVAAARAWSGADVSVPGIPQR